MGNGSDRGIYLGARKFGVLDFWGCCVGKGNGSQGKHSSGVSACRNGVPVTIAVSGPAGEVTGLYGVAKGCIIPTDASIAAQLCNA